MEVEEGRKGCVGNEGSRGRGERAA